MNNSFIKNTIAYSLLTLAIFALVFTIVSSVSAQGVEKVMVCKANQSASLGGFVSGKIEVALPAIQKGLADSGMNADIVPPGTTGFPDGQNWDFVYASGFTGEQIWNNDCANPTTGMITVVKEVENSGVSNDTFSFTVNAGSPIPFEADGSNEVEVLLADAPYTVVEVEANGSGYDTTYEECTDMEAGDTCTITNRYDDVTNPDDDTPPTVPLPQQCIGSNLLQNGSFEEPVVTNPSNYQFFANPLGWLVTKVADATEAMLEFHRGWSGNQSADGAQYVELDSNESVRIAQTVATEAGATYELFWSFAPRHNAQSAEHNQLSVGVNGTEVATEGPDTGSAPLTPADWTNSSYSFIASGTTTTVSFADAGPSNSFGTFLDNAVLCKTIEPVTDEDDDDKEEDNGGDTTPGNGVVNTCFIPDTLGDTSPIVISDESGEKTIAEMFAEHGFGSVDVLNDETNFQIWTVNGVNTNTVTFDLTVLGKRAGNTQIFGYYKAGETIMVAELLTQVADTDGGPTVEVSIPAEFGESFGFAIKSNGKMWFSEKSLNDDGMDHVAVYNPTSNTFLIAFEDFDDLGDSDYNDFVIKISSVSCSTRSEDENENDDDETDNGENLSSGSTAPSNTTSTRVGGRGARGGQVAGDSLSFSEAIEEDGPEPQVLGEQVSMVPYGGANAGAGGTALPALPAIIPLLSLLSLAFAVRFQRGS